MVFQKENKMDHYSTEALNHLNESQLKDLLYNTKKILKDQKMQKLYDQEYSTNVEFCYNLPIDQYGTNFP